MRLMENKKITFYINNEAYTVNIGPDKDDAFKDELTKFIPTQRNINTKELLAAYIKQSHQLVKYNNELEKLLDKLNGNN